MPGIQLERVSSGNKVLRKLMEIHYSQPKGFVGRRIPYLVHYAGSCFGAIVAGSATRFLPGRDEFVGSIHLNNIVNNVFFHIEPVGGCYPCRNFTPNVVRCWREHVLFDWPWEYDDAVLAWETLVELPRTGELYKRDGWVEVGITYGYTCKRIAGKSTDSWTGRRVWDTKNLRPKRVFVRLAP